MKAGFVGINSDYSTLLDLCGICIKDIRYPVKVRLGAGIIGANLNNTGAGSLGRNQDGAKIKVIGKNRITVLPGIGHDFNILCICRADSGPVDSLNLTSAKHIRPTNREIHINDYFHTSG